jgi:hypothetical protein
MIKVGPLYWASLKIGEVTGKLTDRLRGTGPRASSPVTARRESQPVVDYGLRQRPHCEDNQ